MKKTGVAFALLAYTVWGLFPVFWKLLQEVPHEQVLAHRIVWSSLFFASLLVVKNGASGAGQLLAEASAHWRRLALSAALLALNWFVYISAVNSGFVLEASLGYFIAPLVNMAAGVIVLRERPRLLALAAIAAAAAGVAWLALHGDRFPSVSLALGMTWGIYGLIRKATPAAPLAASTLESGFLVLPALVLLASGGASGHLAAMTATQSALAVLGGAITALPLLWFAEAARRLPLSSLGFFQFITPSLQFALAVGIYGERFTAVHATAFSFIWLGLALFVLDALASSGAAFLRISKA